MAMNFFSNTKTLVPIDFSEYSKRAVETAMQVTSNANIFLLHVVDPAQLYGFDDNGGYELGGGMGETMGAKQGAAELEKQHRDAALKAMQGLFGDEKHHGIVFAVVISDPPHGIAQFATENKVGLIVLPSHGRTGAKRLSIGSVAERVVRLSHCPVLVLRE
ncbi:universal stress protein [Stieleria marina]|uniref:Universal stress protein family protein n=1 Tax=Stieleria marina TaxID=1930275 RepID=A0A517NZX9_9BACT|nr:Universal stress protein family protein [Planctomycetes bacterium K23_9]